MREGDEIGFGTRQDRWQLIDDGPPGALARPVQGGPPARAEGGMLALPSAESPECVALEVSEGLWILETDSAQEPVVDQQLVPAGGVLWRLYLPVALPRTTQSDLEVASPLVPALHFAVSRDEEYVGLTVRDGERATRLKPRTFHYMLLTLARIREQDSEASARERGWIYIDELAVKLGVDARTINVYVMRARQQLGDAGVPPAALIERRPGARLRMGSLPVTVASL